VVELPESYVGIVRLGLNAKVQFEALGGSEFPGTVTAILPETSNDARTFPVQVSVDNPKLSIKAGMLGLVEFQPSNVRPVTVVPKDALVRKDTGHFVYVIGPGDRVVETRVNPGSGVGLWVDVGGSGRAGDRVVTRGNERLANGQTVSANRQKYELP
jgi:RND family efflux transporter MFP subunit